MGIKSHGNQIPWESNPLGIKSLGSQIPWESNPLGIESLEQHWTLSGWGLRDDTGVLEAGDWRQHWRLGGWGVEMTLET